MITRPKRIIVASLLAIALGGSLLLALLFLSLPRQPSLPPGGGPGTGSGSFSFAVAGDFGGPTSPDMNAMAARMRGGNATFLLALGDLGYTSDEAAWCSAIKGHFNGVEIVAGNHDTTESGPGDIAQAILACPFTLGVNLTGGPGLPDDGYGREYYFDFPSGTPLARFILVTAGVRGQLNYDYNPGSTHFDWVVDAVSSARSASIPWVIVGMHKQCVTVGAKSDCSMGQALFDELVDLKVDLILQAHDHVYERSKQLSLGALCPTVLTAGQYDAGCVVDDGSQGNYGKGAGSVAVVVGTGGGDLYSVRIDGSDAELGYFVRVMGGNANTEGLQPGFGYAKFAVTRERIVVQTDFCPAGATDGEGFCVSSASSTFQDSFSLTGANVSSSAVVLAPIGMPARAPMGLSIVAAAQWLWRKSAGHARSQPTPHAIILRLDQLPKVLPPSRRSCHPTLWRH